MKHRGFTLIELIVFILIIGIIATGSLIALNTVLTYVGTPREYLRASQLARARMEIILKARQGNFNFTDPCVTTPSLAACTQLANFATSNNLAANSQIINESAQYRLVNVNITGALSLSLSTRVANYENP
jgi:prepilin-type N-terminal cleavage/methylation domain-containing protein